MAETKNRVLYQLKVTLHDVHPPIWRRLQVWDDTTLPQLHRILQVVMGWEDYHLHEFHIGRRVYAVPDPDNDLNDRRIFDERRQPLRMVVQQVGTYSSTCTTSATAGDMNCCWRLSYSLTRSNIIPAAWPENAPDHPKTWVVPWDTPTTWKPSRTPVMESTRICSHGVAPSTLSRFRSPPSTADCKENLVS